MKNLQKTTITGVTLAVSCSLSGLAIEAEASMPGSTPNEHRGDRSIDEPLTVRGVPSLDDLGLVAAAPTATTADNAQVLYSRLISGLSSEAESRYSTQAEALLVANVASDRSYSIAQTVNKTVSNSLVGSASADLNLYSEAVPSLDQLGLAATSKLPAQPTQVYPTQVYSARLAESASSDTQRASRRGNVETANVVERSMAPLHSAQTTIAQVDTTSPSNNEAGSEEIRQQLLTTPNPVTEPVPEIDVLDRRPQPIPSSTFITPNAYGADWGDFYLGTAGTTEDTDDGLDASASLGMGFGNAVDNVGVELNVGIISIDGFADDGSVGFKIHKLFPKANNLGVAVGWTNPITWGAAEEDEDTIYGVVTQRFDLRPNKQNAMPLTTSLGVGTGAFRSVGAIEAGDNAPNIFGSVGVRVIPQVSLVSSWNGSGLGLAASAAPFNFPVVLTAGVSDLTDNTEEGTQFVGGLGYSFGF